MAGSLFLPVPWAWVWAQSGKEGLEGALKLVKAPKLALVIGNSKYKDAPELKNPANDAKGVGEALKAAGFAVTTKLDTGKEELIQAIRDYVNGMEKQKAVGLFYFAGHGVQLAWRNYMLPVDAVIDKIDDVAKQSVDIARLMEGLTKAGNPMNVIILDACRENPFGKDFKVEHKGLSQMDAPTHTILAYATSPGNVASDGDGANGLYTENLLREMKVKEAKIEDVFKRVRLGVRRKTNGAQIPWESTSLEDDFWFLPPAELKKLSEEEKEEAFTVELALWEKIAEAKDAAPFEDYLRRYPSGRFAELAQL
ncbi:MAG TPA: caspase family protein, partial [Burkholderiales bacterium]